MSLLQRMLIAGRGIQYKRPLTTFSVQLSKQKDDTVSTSSSSSSSSSDSDSDDEKKKLNEKKDIANTKLNALLKSLIEEEKSGSPNTVSNLELAKPRQREIEQNKIAKEKHDPKVFEEKLVKAAKDVAEEIGGSVKETEAELLDRLLFKRKPVEEKKKKKETGLNKKPIVQEKQDNLGAATLNELLSGMRIDRTVKKDTTSNISRADQVRSILAKKSVSQQMIATTEDSKRRSPPPQKTRFKEVAERVNLFGEEPLGIFTEVVLKDKEQPMLETWNQCLQRELKVAVTHPPTNIYEQMILWTEKGILWHFPIDNTQGLEEEKKVYFSEHVHLEKHIVDWCPEKGPVRHFMELVCVGLSKNPWLTVEEKKNHLFWFKDYFMSKHTILKEIGAGEIKLEGKIKEAVQ